MVKFTFKCLITLLLFLGLVAYGQYGPNDDADGDGIVNNFDKDNDNDGIPDISEGCDNIVTIENNGSFGITSITRDTANPPGGGYVYGAGINGGIPAARYAVISQQVQWHTIGWGYPGHTTGTINDAYLAINGSTSVGIFYREDFTLSADVNYNYSIWHAAGANGSLYNLQIRIRRLSDNTIVASINTGSVSSAIWTNIGLSLIPSTTGLYRAELVNLSTAAGGNDFAIDDIRITSNCTQDTDGDGIPNEYDTDSDNDGCPDAIEAEENVSYSQLNSDGSINYGVTGGLDSQGVPNLVNVGGHADSNGSQGQGIGTGSFLNPLINSCYCYKSAVTTGTVLSPHMGITSLNRAGADPAGSNWPMVRKGAWAVLESKSKGFVPNRLTTAQINSIPAANIVEGMMVYNTDLNCLQINTTGTSSGWVCFNNQGCPTN